MEYWQIEALLPFIVLAAAAIVSILLIAARCSHLVIQVAGFIMMCIAVAAMWRVRSLLPVYIKPLLLIDGMGAWFTGIIVMCVLVTGWFSYVYFQKKEENPKEYYILIFLSTLGGAILTVSVHFVSFFLGLELLSVSLYALIAYRCRRSHAIEAGVKYLVQAAITSGFLLFGMALVYMQTGSMEFSVIASRMLALPLADAWLLTGWGMMLVAVGFKLALVPFHLWAADVYQGAPAPVAGFIATVSKIGVFAVLLRFAAYMQWQQHSYILFVLSAVAILSMIAGNMLALLQSNIKRLLAYSSIAHLGYVLVAFLPGSRLGAEAVAFYLFAYAVTLSVAFGVIAILSPDQQDADRMENYRGMFWRRPLLSVVFMLSMLSLAGLPLTAGFIGKYYLLAAGVQAALWLPVFVLVLVSVAGLYYYLRIINVFFAEPAPGLPPHLFTSVFSKMVTYGVFIILTCLLLGAGVYPDWLIGVIQQWVVPGK